MGGGEAQSGGSAEALQCSFTTVGTGGPFGEPAQVQAVAPAPVQLPCFGRSTLDAFSPSWMENLHIDVQQPKCTFSGPDGWRKEVKAPRW